MYQPVQPASSSSNGSYYTPAPPKPAVDATSRDYACAFFTVLLCALGAVFTLDGGFYLGFTLSYLGLIALSVCYLLPLRRINAFSLLCAGFGCACSIVFTLYSDLLIRFCLFWLMVLCTCLFLSISCKSNRHTGWRTAIDIARTLFYLPVAYIVCPFRSLFARTGRTSRTLLKILLGLCCAVPVLLIVIPLLIRSDAAFEGLLHTLFGSLRSQTIFFLIVGLLCSPLLFSLLFALKKGLDQPNAPINPKRTLHIVDAVVINTLLGTLCICYLIYLFSQLSYFFSAFSGMLPEGYTFTAAEYARRGFFEMCGVCVVNLSILFAAHIFKKEQQKPRAVQLFSLFILVFTQLLICISFSKMALYISSFGLTRLRVLTCIFMVLLTAVVIVGILRLFCKRLPYFQILILCTCCVMTATGYADIDRIIAAYNISAYEQGRLDKLDIESLLRLSDSAIPALDELADSNSPYAPVADRGLRTLAQRRLTITDDDRALVPDAGVISYNLARNRTVQLLAQRYNRRQDAGLTLNTWYAQPEQASFYTASGFQIGSGWAFRRGKLTGDASQYIGYQAWFSIPAPGTATFEPYFGDHWSAARNTTRSEQAICAIYDDHPDLYIHCKTNTAGNAAVYYTDPANGYIQAVLIGSMV